MINWPAHNSHRLDVTLKRDFLDCCNQQVRERPSLYCRSFSFCIKFNFWVYSLALCRWRSMCWRRTKRSSGAALIS
jgi:hypothetical protein|eukprot:COSAG06_NODE_4938_length_3846_cov_29.655006_5_plen_76_part_00